MVVKSSHTGLRDWLVQRITAIIIGIYALFLLSFILINQPLYFAQWQSLFQSGEFQNCHISRFNCDLMACLVGTLDRVN